MAIRAIIGFEDFVPKAEVYGNWVTGNKIDGTPLTLGMGAAGSQMIPQYSQGWMKLLNETGSAGTNVSKLCCAMLDLASLTTLNRAAVVTIGVRFSSPYPDYGNGTIWLSQPAPGAASQTMSLFPSTVLPGGVITPNQEYYLEATLDFPNATIHRWIDGVAIADLPITTQILASLDAATGIVFSIGNPVYVGMWRSYNYTIWFKDMYILEKTADGLYSSRLGPQVVTPVDPNAIAAPNWTTASGTLLAALNTPITDLASASTPVVNTDLAKTPGEISFPAPAVTGKINGVLFTHSSLRSGGAAGAIKASVVTGESESTPVTTTLATAVQLGVRAYLGSVAPDGEVWTPAKLATAKLKLTPA